MFTFFIHLNATPAWLLLTEQEREIFVEQKLAPLFGHYPAVEFKFYDAEAFGTKCSDIAIFETAELEQYTALIDDIRSSALVTVPYFEIVDIFPAKRAYFI